MFRHRKIQKMFVLIIVFIVVLAAVIDRNKGLLRLHELKKEKENIDNRIIKLRNEKQYLRSALNKLRTDMHYIEDIARSELGYCREGEQIYRFRE